MAHTHHPQKKKGSVRGAAPVQNPHVHSQPGKRAKQLLTDSRSAVIAKHKAAEKQAAQHAPVRKTAAEDRAAMLALVAANSGAAADNQRDRLLRAFRAGIRFTTNEAIRYLDIVSPNARICELRQMGFDIETTIVRQQSPCGRLHKYGLFRLIGDGGAA